MALTQVKTTGLADDAVTGAKIADDTVAEANMANDAISLTELKAGTDGQIITYDASGDPVAVGPGNDGQVLTSTGAGSPPAFETLPTSGPTLTGSTNNTVVTVTGSNAIAGEATFTYNGSDTLKVAPAGASPAVFIGESDRTTADQQLAEFSGHWDGTAVARMLFHVGADTTNKDEGRITFQTAAPGGTLTERLRIDENGIVTKPAHPAFRAQRSGTSWNHSSGTLAWNNQIFDTGNDYDDSSYTFTCPVDGVYLFICSVMQEHGGTGGNMTFRKNGSAFNTTQWTAAGGTSDWDGYDMVSIVSCSKDDAILSNHGSNSNFHGGNYAHFSGYLIG